MPTGCINKINSVLSALLILLANCTVHCTVQFSTLPRQHPGLVLLDRTSLMNKVRKGRSVAFCAMSPSTSVQDAIRYFRLERSALLGPDADDVETICSLHFGLQAQDAETVLLSMYNRLNARAVRSRKVLSERFLFATNRKVRGTIHLFTAHDWPVAASATRERLTALINSAYTRGPRGVVDSAAFVDAEISHLVSTAHGAEATLVDAYTQNRAASIVLCRFPFMRAAMCGLGSRSRCSAIVLVPRTCEWRSVDALETVCEAARAYFSCYAPAREEDFRYWMGLRAGDSRAAVNSLVESGSLVQVVGLPTGWLVAENFSQRFQEWLRNTPPREKWPVRLLRLFDSYLLPQKDKRWIIDDIVLDRVWRERH